MYILYVSIIYASYLQKVVVKTFPCWKRRVENYCKGSQIFFNIQIFGVKCGLGLQGFHCLPLASCYPAKLSDVLPVVSFRLGSVAVAGVWPFAASLLWPCAFVVVLTVCCRLARGSISVPASMPFIKACHGHLPWHAFLGLWPFGRLPRRPVWPLLRLAGYWPYGRGVFILPSPSSP